MSAMAIPFCINDYNVKSAKCRKRDLVLHLECSDTLCINRFVLVQCTMQELIHASWSCFEQLLL